MWLVRLTGNRGSDLARWICACSFSRTSCFYLDESAADVNMSLWPTTGRNPHTRERERRRGMLYLNSIAKQ